VPSVVAPRTTRVAFVPMIDVATGANLIVVCAEIGAPRELLWRALTEKGRIVEWWGGHVLLEARPRGRFAERWTDAGGREVVTSGEVIRMEAPQTLELTWADDDWDEPTRVLFRLEETADDTTRLTLEHSGWETFPSPAREELVRAHASGWSRHVANLAVYSEGTPR
jgi:uncharacterized protein YndB with AHSA1/START domain